jgi:hypothetical protein
MDKKQTAVEWYIDELEKYEKGTSEYFSIPAIQNHARRMEKKQIKDAYYNGTTDEIRTKEELLFEAEHFYNETYGGDK